MLKIKGLDTSWAYSLKRRILWGAFAWGALALLSIFLLIFIDLGFVIGSTGSFAGMEQTIFFGIGIGFGLLGIGLIVSFLSGRLDKYITGITGLNFDITALYSMVDRLSRTIDMDELRLIVVEAVMDVLAADEVTIILPRADGKYSAFKMRSGSPALERIKFQDDHPMAEVVEGWLKVTLTTPVISEDAKTLYLPVVSVMLDERPLALIVCRNEMLAFPETHIDHVRGMCGYIATALENSQLYGISSAITDELTGLYTPKHFDYCIERELSHTMRTGIEMSLLMVDIDNLKSINDAHGRRAGDAALREAAYCVAGALRSNDPAFRRGQEGFSVLLPQTGLPEAVVVAERIRKSVETKTAFVEGEPALKATVSIGAACCRSSENLSAKDFIKKADDALRAAGNSGGNMVVSAR
jgi:diguanylate cyclase (GGDEF)-like protein